MTPNRKEDDLKPTRKEYLTPLELSEKIGITQAGLKSWESQIRVFRPSRVGSGKGYRDRRYSRRDVAIAFIIRDLRKNDVGMRAIDEFLQNAAIPMVYNIYLKYYNKSFNIRESLKELIKQYEKYMEES